jgi:hypothetical protein
VLCLNPYSLFINDEGKPIASSFSLNPEDRLSYYEIPPVERRRFADTDSSCEQ